MLSRPRRGVHAQSAAGRVGARSTIPLTFQFDDLDALQAFNDDIYRISEAQGLPVDALTQESGPSQFEINLKPQRRRCAGGARRAPAQARRQGRRPRPRPHRHLHGQAAPRLAGSGMHIHMSLLDKAGANVFAGDPISPLFRHALGGLRETMGDFMAIWAQSANAYRRYVPESYVSMAPHWGFNNRTVALRIPDQLGPGTRVEHRVAGADANPYLVIAAMLAGRAHGIANKIDPGPEVKGNSEELDAALAADRLGRTHSSASNSRRLSATRSAPTSSTFTRGSKDTERTNFERIVTSLDHLWYAQVA